VKVCSAITTQQVQTSEKEQEKVPRNSDCNKQLYVFLLNLKNLWPILFIKKAGDKL
jgi:hypothetical protein